MFFHNLLVNLCFSYQGVLPKSTKKVKIGFENTWVLVQLPHFRHLETVETTNLKKSQFFPCWYSTLFGGKDLAI